MVLITKCQSSIIGTSILEKSSENVELTKAMVFCYALKMLWFSVWIFYEKKFLIPVQAQDMFYLLYFRE